MSDSQLSVPCLRCNAPSVPHGEHHHREGWGPVGKGLGGDEHHTRRVPMCREHHEDVHLGRFTLMVAGEIASTWADGHCQSERALTVNDEHEDTRYWSVEKLADMWGAAHEAALRPFAIQCQVAYEFERRFKWMDEWSAVGAQLIGRLTGRVVHARTVEDRADLWVAFEGRWDDFDFVGSRVAISIARSSDIEAALELGKSLIDEGNHKRTEVAQAITDAHGKRASRGEPCETTCEECGKVLKHRRKKEA